MFKYLTVDADGTVTMHTDMPTLINGRWQNGGEWKTLRPCKHYTENVPNALYEARAGSRTVLVWNRIK